MPQNRMVGPSRGKAPSSEAALRPRTLGRAAFLGLFLVVAALGTADARAEGRASSRDARALFTRGQGSYSVGNYEDAIRDWSAAYEIDPRPLIQFNLSQAYERLGRLTEAIEALDRFLAEAQPGDPTYAEANARAAALRQRLSRTGVRILGGPDGGRIQVDGRDWGVTPRPDRIPVDPGQHTIAVHYPDGRRFDASVAVPAGMVVDVAASEAGGAPEVIGVADDGGVVGADGRADERGAGPLPWIIAGGATAGVGAGVFLYGVLRQTELSGCDDSGYVCLNESTVQTQRTAGMITGALLMAGGAALITVGVLSGRRGPEGSAEVACGVGLGSASCRVEF